jgi:farnesyl diphosphate synthase
VDTVEILKGAALDDDEYYKAAILGWGVELVSQQRLCPCPWTFLTALQLQAFFLVTDDIMDTTITRRGQPCWYRVPGVGMNAINDAITLEATIYYLLKKHFRGMPYYVDLLELFQETAYRTEMGQLVDLITAPEDKVDLSKFSLDKCVFPG